ncbi:MAG TPA: ABC transporter permease, partial [Acidimicrobiales bacterium]|nr:ABC transporter permease [Acidimicrobiales bacterium]
PSNDLSIFDTDGVNVHRIIKLLSGRWPTKPDEVLAGFSFEQAAGLHVGSVIRVPTYARSQAAQVYGSGQNVVPHGPIERFVVVGFEVNILDFPSSTPSYSLVASPAFLRAAHRSVLTGSVAFYRLDGGAAGLGRFAYVINHVTTGLYYPFGFDATLEAIESSIHPQVVGWWLFALLAALTGLALIGQALARQSLVERESFPTLSALGLTPSQLTGLGLMRATSIALVGSAGAVLLALLVSPLTPVGEARAAATSSGFFLDGLVVGVGALAIVLCVVGFAAYPAFRAAQARALVAAEERTVARSSRVARGLGRLGAAPSVLIGVRHALERGRGRGSVPVATALLGAVAAVTAISGTSVFGASLTRLLDTPHLYGQNWTVDLSGFNSRGAQQVAAHAARLPGVEAVTYGVSNKEITVNGVAANLVAVETAKGAPLFTSISGAFPGLGEIGVGSQTLAAAHARVGGMVTVGVIGPNGRSYTRRLRVSGTLVFPPVLSAGAGLGDGAAIAYPEVFQVLCGTGSSTSPCVR